MVNKIPTGNTLIPTLMIAGAAKAMDLYIKAFGAKEEYRMEYPDGSGKIMHACLSFGNTRLFLADANPEAGCGTPSASSFYLYVEDVDAVFQKAKQAGLTESMAPTDMFWGDRMGSLKDSFGIQWSIGTHVRDVSPQEMEQARKEFGKKVA